MIQIEEQLIIQVFDVLRGRIPPETIGQQEVKVIMGLVKTLTTQCAKDKIIMPDGEEVQVQFFRDWLKEMERV